MKIYKVQKKKYYFWKFYVWETIIETDRPTQIGIFMIGKYFSEYKFFKNNKEVHFRKNKWLSNDEIEQCLIFA